MEIKSKFDHFNINVTNLERSITFYEKALGLKEHHRKEASDGSFTLVYLTDGSTGFLLELTCLKEHPQAYELGENESHLCFRAELGVEATQTMNDLWLSVKTSTANTTTYLILTLVAIAAVAAFFIISGIVKRRKKARRCRKWKQA